MHNSLYFFIKKISSIDYIYLYKMALQKLAHSYSLLKILLLSIHKLIGNVLGLSFLRQILPMNFLRNVVYVLTLQT